MRRRGVPDARRLAVPEVRIQDGLLWMVRIRVLVGFWLQASGYRLGHFLTNAADRIECLGSENAVVVEMNAHFDPMWAVMDRLKIAQIHVAKRLALIRRSPIPSLQDSDECSCVPWLGELVDAGVI